MSALLNTYLEMVGPDACKNDNGLLALVDAQTGLGKTYQAIDLQLEHLLADSKKTIIYATNLRVNVKEAYEDLLERIDNSDSFTISLKSEVKQNVILIPSQETSIKELSENDWKNILNALEINEQKDIKSFLTKVKLIEQVKMHRDSDEFDDELREKYSSIFKALKSCFRKKENLPSHLEDILNRIFPARLLDENKTQVIFMTTAKLLYPWHGIHKTHRISGFLKNALLILDEFDRQQSELLNHLINSVSDYDIIALTRKFYASFDSFEISGSAEFDGVDKCFNNFRTALKDHKQKWGIQLRPFMTNATVQKGSENQNRIFTLLSDRMSIHAINFKHEDLRSNINYAIGSHEIGPHGDESAIQFVNNGAQLVRIFCNGMLRAVQALENNIKKSNDTKSYTTENFIEKILNHFGLPEMTKSIMSLISSRLSFKVKNEYKTYSFHDSGFELANISKYSETDDTVIASTFDLALTSSGLLAHWVHSGAKILGISATATSQTAIHNFDLEYLRDVLSDQLIFLNNEQKISIQKEYHAKRRYKENEIQIRLRSISKRVPWGGIEKIYSEFKGDNYSPLLFEDDLSNLLGVTHQNLRFNVDRLNKLIESIRVFSEHPFNRYHFCMLNRSYKTQEFFEFIDFIGQKFDVHIFENINAASFRNDQFKNVLAELENTNNKIVVITNYQATGAGLSPSYKIRSKQKLIYIGPDNSKPIQNKTDIDSIYIEQPKNLIGSHVHGALTNQEMNQAIKQNIHDALMMHEKGIIVANEVKQQLKWFISPKVTWKAVSNMIKTYKSSEDYRYAIYRFVEQALGRMCRTEWKQPEVSIMFDAEEDFVETLANDNRDLSFLSFEYQELIKHVKEHHKASVTKKQEISYSPKASRNYAHIQRLITSVYEHQNPNAIGQYERLREWMLKNPTLDTPPEGEQVRYYIDTKGISGNYQYQINYSEEKGITEIFINPPDVSNARDVSESSARLLLLMQNPIVKSYFNARGFAESFGVGRYVLAPAMFDIYMGALGEEAVSAVLNHFGYELKKMPQGCSEWFDGYLDIGSRIILVDIKHWNLDLQCLINDNTLKKCQKKLLKIKNNQPQAFQNKSIQAIYINTLHDESTAIVSRKFSIKDDSFVEYANPMKADVIDVSGIFDMSLGINNVSPINKFLELLQLFERESQ